MKWCFKLLLLIFFSSAAYSKNIEATYTVKGKGVPIGILKWELEIKNGFYKTFIYLKSTGATSLIYNFNGSYSSTGREVNGYFTPSLYKQRWVTKKKVREVEIIFENFKIKNLNLKPKEKEYSRINYLNLENFNDPLTSFINILLNEKPFRTIDGRRTYSLNPIKKPSFTKILINDYKNIWADHKRNDLEYLEFYKDKKNLLPKKINIKFKGSLFSLIKN